MKSVLRRLDQWRYHRNTVLSTLAVLLILLLTVGTAAGATQAITGSKADAAKLSPVAGQTFKNATDTTGAPFAFEENGELVGIDMDLIHRDCGELGVRSGDSGNRF